MACSPSFISGTPKDFRFTFAARDAALNEAGQLVRNETAPRRYTYLLGPNESCRTAAERFGLLADRGHNAELKDVVEAFNVEKRASFVRLLERVPKACYGLPRACTHPSIRVLSNRPYRRLHPLRGSDHKQLPNRGHEFLGCAVLLSPDRPEDAGRLYALQSIVHEPDPRSLCLRG